MEAARPFLFMAIIWHETMENNSIVTLIWTISSKYVRLGEQKNLAGPDRWPTTETHTSHVSIMYHYRRTLDDTTVLVCVRG